MKLSICTWMTLLLAQAEAAKEPSTAPVLSFGTIISCPTSSESKSSSCLWHGENSERVDAVTLQDQMLARYAANAPPTQLESKRKLLQQHMQYMEDVYHYANQVNHQFSYRIGVNPRHLVESSFVQSEVLPHQFVEQERQAARHLTASRRRLVSSTPPDLPASLNWCTTDNPKKRSVCTAIKSQEKCGSCWAFAATDSIETAVSIESGSNPQALSSQQLITCSNRSAEQTFSYCWVTKDEVSKTGASWLDTQITWKSTNEGCDGGMTHGAFMDAAQLHFNLVSDLSMPYDDSDGVNKPKAGAVDKCNKTPEQAAASIRGWEQVVGKDCTSSKDPSVLLKKALQRQPISVAINSDGDFKKYKGGIYQCPNGGNLFDRTNVNHALVLVGYGHDDTQGDFWVLKNSYGGQWGEQGFMRLLADTKTNCGVNVFPVIPTGAQAGAAVVTVDGGGDKKFVGLSFSSWITLAVISAVATVIATIGGVMFTNRRLQNIREQNSGVPTEMLHG